VKELFEAIEQKYKIQIKTVNIAGGGPIYSDLVLGLESKK
jgi:diaminopimelate decarboxylase